MSSSRVIKSGSSPNQPVANFCFNNFQQVPAQVSLRSGDGFMPFFHESPPQLSEDDEQEFYCETPPPEEVEMCAMIRLTEEELQNKLQEAFDKGAEEEKKQADEDLAGIYSALCEAISIVSKLKERIVRESEDELLKLAFQVAKKIVRQEIKNDRRILAQLVSEALKGFPEQHDIVVSLNPEDYRVITSNRELFLAGIGDERQLTLKSDESTTLGGCIVESSTGVIDARIEAQLDEIYKSLVEERSRLDDSANQSAASMPDEELTP
jgi:flagellar assembly protein FliH